MLGFLRIKKQISKPRLPHGVRIYAISDIHGCADLLREMFAVIDNDLANIGSIRPIHVFLGDYIDRGTGSRQTIDLLVDRAHKHESVFMKGNHEAMMFEVLKNPPLFQSWKQYGGLQTLASYGLKPSLNPDATEQAELIRELRQSMPLHHRRFYNNLRLSFVCGDFFFVHAGVRPGVPLDQQSEADLLWIREEFLDSDERFAKYIVHGHTPVLEPDRRANRINIDTGAYATGNLTLLTIQGSSILAL